MTRGLTTAAAAAVAQEVPVRTAAVELDFLSATVRLNGSPVSIWIGADEYLGVGGFGAISVIEESAELRAYGVTLQLSGIPRDMVAAVLADAYQGRRATLYEVPIDRTTWQPVADPVVVFRGRMDQMDVSIGETAKVAVRLENRLADWERPRVRRYTDVDQRRTHPTDQGLRFVQQATEKEIAWPARSFFERR